MSDQSFVSEISDKTKDAILFCMPGHNGKLTLSASLDITELDFSDNLQNPVGIIKKLEDKIAKLYNVDNTLLFTNGATSAIAAAIATAKHFGKVLGIAENTHKSVFNYARLLGLDIVDITHPFCAQTEFAAILITSPNYLGQVSDCTKYRDMATKYNVPLIIDQSHGAHFLYSKLLPNVQDNIADITINSMHKTMPVLTGGAIASVRAPYAPLMRYNRALLHTTSPSYLIMSTIDTATDEFSKFGESYYANIYIAIKAFEDTISTAYKIVETDDFTRLIVNVTALNSRAVAGLLTANKIYIEMTYRDNLVLIITPYNYQHLPKLAALLNDIAEDKHSIYTDFLAINHANTTQVQSLDAEYINQSGDIEFIPLRDALGKTVAVDLGLYPPGVPLLHAGDILNEQIHKLLLDNQNNCFGLVGETIACLRR